MDAKTLSILFLVLAQITFIESWKSVRSPRESRNEVHHHAKRHMLPRDVIPRDMYEARLEARRKRRTTTTRTKELRKKPSGHLKPLQDDEMENDEVVSVAIGPPAMRPKYDKMYKHNPKLNNRTTINDTISTNLVKDVLVQLGKEFLAHEVNEDFIFGQYIGNCMKNLSTDLRLKMQHEILDLIVRYQKLNRGEVFVSTNSNTTIKRPYEESTTHFMLRAIKTEKKINDTDEVWPDFTNLANIVG